MRKDIFKRWHVLHCGFAGCMYSLWWEKQKLFGVQAGLTANSENKLGPKLCFWDAGINNVNKSEYTARSHPFYGSVTKDRVSMPQIPSEKKNSCANTTRKQHDNHSFVPTKDTTALSCRRSHLICQLIKLVRMGEWGRGIYHCNVC